MGADCHRAVGIGAAQREVHAPGDVLGCAVAPAVFGGSGKSALEGAVRILRARPDVALVQVGMHVHQARPHHAAVEISAVRSLPGRSSRMDLGDPAAGNVNVHLDQFFR